MSDRRLRMLERRWMESGSPVDRSVYAAERARMGLPKLPRLKIVHYIDDEYHGHLGADGEFSLTENQARRRTIRVISRCAVELWPRERFTGAHYRTMRKSVYYTERPEEVTCKTCLRSLNKPDERVRYRSHYAPGCWKGRERKITPVPVCGRDDGEKFTQTFTYRMREVNCPACKRIMKKGLRASRKPTSIR